MGILSPKDREEVLSKNDRIGDSHQGLNILNIRSWLTTSVFLLCSTCTPSLPNKVTTSPQRAEIATEQLILAPVTVTILRELTPEQKADQIIQKSRSALIRVQEMVQIGGVFFEPSVQKELQQLLIFSESNFRSVGVNAWNRLKYSDGTQRDGNGFSFDFMRREEIPAGLRNPIAFYKLSSGSKEKTIFLAEDFDPRIPVDQFVLLHELQHVYDDVQQLLEGKNVRDEVYILDSEIKAYGLELECFNAVLSGELAQFLGNNGRVTEVFLQKIYRKLRIQAGENTDTGEQFSEEKKAKSRKAFEFLVPIAADYFAWRRNGPAPSSIREYVKKNM